MKTIVSVVPLPLERDSRSLKIAASLARLGFRSLAAESLPSGRPEALPVPTVTLTPFPSRPTATTAPKAAASRRPSRLREPLHLATMVALYFVALPILGLFRLPRADLYYLHEYRLFPTVWLKTLFHPAPIIYDAHDFYPEVWAVGSLSPFWREVFLPFLGWWEGWCARRAAQVVMVGQGVADLFAARYGVRPRILRNCHDARLECPPAKTLRQSLGLDAEALLLVTIGNRKGGQAVEQAIAALATLPGHVHLAFVGRFYDDAREIARRHGVEARVHPVGAVRPEEIVPFVRDASAALILYWPETGNVGNSLPNGFFQSLAAGLPLLYPPLPELVRVIGERPVGRAIDPRDPQSLVAAIGWFDQADAAARTAIRDRVAALAADISWEREEATLAALVQDVWRRT